MLRMIKIGQAAYRKTDNFHDVSVRHVCCGPSVADKSYFHPDSAVIRSASLGAPDSSQYTFANGVDDGREMPPYAHPDADIVDIVAYAKQQDKIVRENVERARKMRAYQEEKAAYEKSQSSQQPVQQAVQQPTQHSD